LKGGLNGRTGNFEWRRERRTGNLECRSEQKNRGTRNFDWRRERKNWEFGMEM
jgi:hypothetical protein